jgi:hypothetical protein
LQPIRFARRPQSRGVFVHAGWDAMNATTEGETLWVKRTRASSASSICGELCDSTPVRVDAAADLGPAGPHGLMGDGLTQGIPAQPPLAVSGAEEVYKSGCTRMAWYSMLPVL